MVTKQQPIPNKVDLQEDEWEVIKVDARLVYNKDPARQSIAANSDPTFRIDRQALFGLRQERWRAAS